MQAAQFELHAEIEDRHWWFVARRQIVQGVLHETVGPSPDRTLLEVGCGTGGNLALLANDYHCVGIDPSEEAITLARRRFPHVRFECGYAPEDVPDIMPAADAVLLLDVLEHVSDDLHLLSSLVAAMRPGAHLLLTVPADMSLWSPHDEAFGHYRRYDESRLRRVWSDLPVVVVMCSYFNARLYPLVKAVRRMHRLLGRTTGRNGTDFTLPRPAFNAALERVFAGESKRLRGLLHGKRSRGYRRGVSMIALLQREW